MAIKTNSTLEWHEVLTPDDFPKGIDEQDVLVYMWEVEDFSLGYFMDGIYYKYFVDGFEWNSDTIKQSRGFDLSGVPFAWAHLPSSTGRLICPTFEADQEAGDKEFRETNSIH